MRDATAVRVSEAAGHISRRPTFQYCHAKDSYGDRDVGCPHHHPGIGGIRKRATRNPNDVEAIDNPVDDGDDGGFDDWGLLGLLGLAGLAGLKRRDTVSRVDVDRTVSR